MSWKGRGAHPAGLAAAGAAPAASRSAIKPQNSGGADKDTVGSRVCDLASDVLSRCGDFVGRVHPGRYADGLAGKVDPTAVKNSQQHEHGTNTKIRTSHGHLGPGADSCNLHWCHLRRSTDVRGERQMDVTEERYSGAECDWSKTRAVSLKWLRVLDSLRIAESV
jgi:hypothetical protein